MASVDAGGIRLEYECAGAGPAVVGLHGLTATRRQVLMGSRTLERGGHKVLLYDARGHGASDPAPAPDAYGYGAQARDLAAVIDGAQLAAVVLVGVSMGAHTLLRFALEHPARVRALVAITPGFDPDDDRPQRLEEWDRLSGALREGGIDGFLDAYDRARIPLRWRDTALTAIRQRLERHEHLDAVADALAAVPRSRPFESLDELRRIAVPALVIGSRDEADPGHPLELAQRYADAMPGARLLVEEPGRSPLAWQGGRLSRLIAELAAGT